MEIWKPIQGYEDKYQVSSRGRVRSINRKVKSGIRFNEYVLRVGKMIKPLKKRNGYLQVSLSAQGKHTYVNIHRLVAHAFIANDDNKPMINHINGIKTDNRLVNLEWCTGKENYAHAKANSLISPSPRRKQLLCVELQKTFPSSYQAAEWLNEKHFQFSKDVPAMARKIRAVATGKQKAAYGYRWVDTKV